MGDLEDPALHENDKRPAEEGRLKLLAVTDMAVSPPDPIDHAVVDQLESSIGQRTPWEIRQATLDSSVVSSGGRDLGL